MEVGNRDQPTEAARVETVFENDRYVAFQKGGIPAETPRQARRLSRLTRTKRDDGASRRGALTPIFPGTA